MTAQIRRGRELLKPHAQRYSDLDNGLRDALRAMSDKDLQALDAATRYFNQTNCWWAEYRVAKKVLGDRVRMEQDYRKRQSEVSNTGTSSDEA